MFTTDTGEVDTYSGGTRAGRNFNPGNITSGSFATAHGAIGKDNDGFAIFSDAATGQSALVALLSTSSVQARTLDDEIATYAPPSENDTGTYQANVEAAVGVSGTTLISALTADQLNTLAQAIKTQEGYVEGTITSMVQAPKVDLSFVVDTTGSMGPYIDAVKADATSLIDAAFSGGVSNTQIGVVSFKDPLAGFPDSVVLPFTTQADFANRQAAAVNAIDSLGADGGGDTPEGDNSGLLLALDGSMGAWRQGASTHRIVLFTDAPVKDTDLAAQVNQYARDVGINSTALTGDPPGDPPVQVQIYTIQVGDDPTATASIQEIASENGGQFFAAPTPDDLTKALLQIITMPSPTSEPTGSGAEHTWDGTVGDWVDASHWLPPGVPLWDSGASAIVSAGQATLTNQEPNGIPIMLGSADATSVPQIVLNNSALGPTAALTVIPGAASPNNTAGFGELSIIGYDTNYGSITTGGAEISPDTLTIAMAPWGQLNNEGTITVLDNSNLLVRGSGDVPSRLNNNGEVTVSGGRAQILSDVTGDGTIGLAPEPSFNGFLEFGGAVSADQTIRLAADTLQIDNPASFLGKISGFDNLTESLVLPNVQADTAIFDQDSPVGGTLSLPSGGAVMASFSLLGTHSSAPNAFSVVPSGGGIIVMLGNLA